MFITCLLLLHNIIRRGGPNKRYEHSHWLGKKIWIIKFTYKNFYVLTHAEGNECADEFHKSSEGPGNIAPMFGWKDKATEPASTG